MRVAFRVDASLQIGTGHVMRCLTLADKLHAHGASCIFICRPHAGHLLEHIAKRGHLAMSLPALECTRSLPVIEAQLAHAAWLGTDWQSDAQDTLLLLGDVVVDWLVVDHYALDCRWERYMRPYARQIMVIDDLADRSHDCDLLLDQTLGRRAKAYFPLVPPYCQILCGSQYALLRPEFAQLRSYSLARRGRQSVIRELLITMGGVDKENITGHVLQALCNIAFPLDIRITVVLGEAAPWLDAVRKQVQDMPWPTRILVGTSDMARLMADSDLAIGAAGATAWERCCLGLPTIMLILADNQKDIAKVLAEKGAALHTELGNLQSCINNIYNLMNKKFIRKMCSASKKITDGLGVERVIEKMRREDWV